MGLYQQYRPDAFEAVIGNQDTIQVLEKMLKGPKDKCPHSFLFSGPTGCGKTTLGRILARELGCALDSQDYVEVDSADFRGIDTVRDIRRNAQFAPMTGRARVWVIDECHKMTNDAQNALLKILEDTPEHVYFILCTTDPNKLITTIRGRCSQFQVTLLTDGEMRGLLRGVVKAEGDSLSKEIYDQITQDAQGHPRNALQVLEQVLAAPPERRIEVAQQTAERLSQTIELCRALLRPAGWKEVAGILSGLKEEDAESIRRAVLGYCQAILLKGDHGGAGLVMECMLEPFYNTGFPGLVFACYTAVKS